MSSRHRTQGQYVTGLIGLALVSALAAGLLAACSEDGTTAKCPGMPIYTWKEYDDPKSGVAAKVAEWRVAAEMAHCATKPGDDLSGTGGAPPSAPGSGGGAGGAN